MKKTANKNAFADRLKRFVHNLLHINGLTQKLEYHADRLDWLKTVADTSQQRLDALEGLATSLRLRVEALEVAASESRESVRTLREHVDALEAIASARVERLEAITSARIERLETSVTPSIEKALIDQVHDQLQDFQKRIDQERIFNPPPVRRPRLAFVSPLPSERSGISEYSADLLPELARYYDIDVIVAQPAISDRWVNTYCPVRSVAWFEQHASDYTRVIYQFGNSPYHSHMFEMLRRHPGVVVLHDFFLSSVLAYEESTGAMPGVWTRALYHSHGYLAVKDSLDAAGMDHARDTYPSNLEVLQLARGVIVHSEHSRQLARQWYGEHATDDWEVIPLLRTPAATIDRPAARRALGIGEQDFVLCTFGFIDPVKLCDRILDAWLASDLRNDPGCRLIFVGVNHPGEYGEQIMARVRSSGCQDRIRITGWTDDAVYKQYLQAADASIQLRGISRGETSAAVLHCMNYGLPTIVNASGSMNELPPDAVLKLPNAFKDAELVAAIESLRHDQRARAEMGAAAREFVRSKHSPDTCAKLYADAIESAYGDTGQRPLLRPMLQGRQLLVDVSTIAHNDLRTGIERVVRAQLSALLNNPPTGFRVEPVYLSSEGGAWHYRYARRYTTKLLGIDGAVLEDGPVEAAESDVFYGLDFSPEAVIEAAQAGLYADWRTRGIEINFLIYDILPVLHPEFFPEHADRLHARWVDAIAENADRLICISQAVADEVRLWLRQRGRLDAERLEIAVAHHGADISASAPTTGTPEDAGRVLQEMGQMPSFLMVGTIEPRKGYLQALAAFEQLWREGEQVRLVIVGKEGWTALPDSQRRTIPEIIAHLRQHPELGKRLFWLQDVSDEYLEQIYAASTCLVFASEGEGFGLPLIEAARHKLPIIARDLPVFREVTGQHACYFSGLAPDDLASGLKNWLRLQAAGKAPDSSAIRLRTWEESVQELTAVLALSK